MGNAQNRAAMVIHPARFPHVHQATATSCGAACLIMCALYWLGEAIPWQREKSVYSALRLGKDGAEPDAIAAVAERIGLHATARTGMTQADLATLLAEGTPVILGLQAWRTLKSPPAWRDDWDDGHYVVAVGIKDAALVVRDPSLWVSDGLIPLDELDDRWHLPLTADERATGVGIPIRGDKPAKLEPMLVA